MSYTRCDVVWSDDPFKEDEDAGRRWLVLNNQTHPFRSKQYMAVALTTSGYDDALTVESENWNEGGVPFQSYVLPWAVQSPIDEDIERRQGSLRSDFVDDVVEEVIGYIR